MYLSSRSSNLLFFILISCTIYQCSLAQGAIVSLENATLQVTEGESVQVCVRAEGEVIPPVTVLPMFQFITAGPEDIVGALEPLLFNDDFFRDCFSIATVINDDGGATEESFAVNLTVIRATEAQVAQVTIGLNRTVITILEPMETTQEITTQEATTTAIGTPLLIALEPSVVDLTVFGDFRDVADFSVRIVAGMFPPAESSLSILVNLNTGDTGFEGDEILAFVSIFPRVFNITAFQTQRFSVFLDSNFRSLFPDIQQLQISISLMEEPSFNAVITQDTSVINLIDVMIATVDVQPSEVEVSEGNAAVVCFSAMELTSFNNPVSISLILMVQNITTSPDDFDSSAVPPVLELSSSFPTSCLQIPTFVNNDGSRVEEFFQISIFPLPSESQDTTQVRLTQNFVLVTIFEDCIDGEVRLMDGGNKRQGRLEVCQDGGFGSLCDVGPWTEDDASVVCRQLGYVPQEGDDATPQVFSGFPQNSRPVVVGNYECDGSEFNISACSLEDSLPQLCTPDVGVQCGLSATETTDPGCGEDEFLCEPERRGCLSNSLRCDGIPDCILQVSPFLEALDEQQCPPVRVCTDGEVRPPFGGVSARDGFLEVCLGGTFLLVTLTNFTVREASVICRELELGSAGFPVSSLDVLDIDDLQNFEASEVIGESVVKVTCAGNEASLRDCSLEAVRSFGDIAAIQCIDAEECSDGEMRLVPPAPSDAAEVREGRLEICYRGVWGAVFDTDWSALDAAVTCQQLGFNPKGALPLLSAVYPSDPPVLPIVLDCPVCNSAQTASILDCPRPAPISMEFLVPDQELLGRGLGQVELGTLVGGSIGVRAQFGIVGVNCEDYQDVGCSEFDVRLAYRSRGGAEGDLEVCSRNQWQSVCETLFSQSEVDVACRALGFTAFEGTDLQHDFGQPFIPGSDSTLFLTCTGNETSVAECGFLPALDCQGDVHLFCLSLPQILLDPPVRDPTGSLIVERNRPASVDCIVDQFSTFPAVISLTGSESIFPMLPPLPLPSGARFSRSSLSNDIFRATAFSTLAASEQDSGNYFCTVLVDSGNSDDLNNIIGIPLLPIRVLTVIVPERFEDLGLDPQTPVTCSCGTSSEFSTVLGNCCNSTTTPLRSYGSEDCILCPAVIPDVATSILFLRFSDISFQRYFNLGIYSTTDELIEELQSRVFFSISSNIPGEQEVFCQSVPRGNVDVMRDLDRYECNISHFGTAGENFTLAQLNSAASALQAFYPNNYMFFNITDQVLCDFNSTTFGDATLSWPETEGGTTASLPCPSESVNVITRSCSGERVWLDPDTSDCNPVLVIINRILNENVTEPVFVQQVAEASTALTLTEVNPQLQVPELLTAVSMYFDAVTELVVSLNGNVSNVSNDTVPPMVVQGLVQVLSSLQQWSASLLASSDESSRIVMDFEVVAGIFAQLIAIGSSTVLTAQIIFVAENAPLALLQMEGRSVLFGSNSFATDIAVLNSPGLSPGFLASVSLPPSLFQTIDDNRTTVGVFFALYDEPTLFPVRQSDVNATFQPAVLSPVVASTVGPGLDFSQLPDPVEINLMLNTSDVVFIEGSERCVSWDFTAAGGQGNWTTEGCDTVFSNGEVVTCQCNHLTNFAILVDICTRTGEECNTNPTLESVLSVLSILGASLSMIALVITIVTMLAFRKLRNRDASKYHVQLSIAIFFMLLVFVSGIDKTAVYGGCVVVSVLIHYFTLAAVMWMGAEAVLMFQKLAFVFRKVTTNEIIITSLACWLVPIVPVLIPLIVDLSTGPSNLVISRGDDVIQFCFLRNPIVFWVAFMAPIFGILLFNLVIYVIVIFILIKHTRGTLARKNESINVRTALRLMVSIAGVMFLFGLSWLFGALTITVTGVRLTFQILFVIFTPLQGVFIFIFFCVFSKEARELWKEVLSCGHYKSEFLNPNLKFSSGTGGERRGVKNGTRNEYSTKSTQDTDSSTLKRQLGAFGTKNGLAEKPAADGHHAELGIKGKSQKEDVSSSGDSLSEENIAVVETNMDDKKVDLSRESPVGDGGKNDGAEKDEEVTRKRSTIVMEEIQIEFN